MAAPVIDSVTVDPATVVIGGPPVTLTVVAHDPDTRPGVLTVVVSDTDNTQVTQQVTVPVSDPVTIEVSTEDEGLTISRTSPSTWSVAAAELP